MTSERASALIITVKCPNCGAEVKTLRGTPAYCDNCGTIFTEDGQILLTEGELW